MLVVTWFLRVIHLNLFNFNDKKKIVLRKAEQIIWNVEKSSNSSRNRTVHNEEVNGIALKRKREMRFHYISMCI